MKKLIVFLIFTLCSFFSFQTIFAYETNMVLSVTIKDNGTPVSGMGVVYGIGGWSDPKSKLTDKGGKIDINYNFNSEYEQNISFILNGNQINITEITNEFKDIIIDYNIESQSIISVSTTGGTNIFSNQAIKQSTNYKLLFIYIFLTLLSSTLLIGGRYIYNSLNRDIYKHKI